MWGKGKRKGKGSSRLSAAGTLVGQGTEIHGDVSFAGRLHVDGLVKGRVSAREEGDALLTLSEHGRIEGDVVVPSLVINGTVKGNVYSSGRVELAEKARITGNVYYRLIEMAMGAEVNGNLVRREEEETLPSVVASSAVAGRSAGDEDQDAAGETPTTGTAG
ncbi:MAG TPA: polymer-forming cytoskeletal protein [Thiotrichales bacterium]|nr:polymer-forming cytoskeletal protein [Thiotrichales bacterium]